MNICMIWLFPILLKKKHISNSFLNMVFFLTLEFLKLYFKQTKDKIKTNKHKNQAHRYGGQIGSHQSVLRICELGFCVCWFLSCLLSVCLLLDSTYKWDSMVFVFFWLISLSTMLYPSICHIWQDFTFLWLNDIPFFNTCHIFFIHWSTDGHLGCLYILATVNNVTVNVGVHISFWVSVFIFIE